MCKLRPYCASVRACVFMFYYHYIDCKKTWFLFELALVLCTLLLFSCNTRVRSCVCLNIFVCVWPYRTSLFPCPLIFFGTFKTLHVNVIDCDS